MEFEENGPESVEALLAASLEVLPGEAWVVRGGQMYVSDLVKNANTTLRKSGYSGVSAWTDAEADVFEIVSYGPIIHTAIRKTTVQRLEEAGFNVVLSGRPGHCDIVKMGLELTEERLKELINVFDPPEPTPKI